MLWRIPSAIHVSATPQWPTALRVKHKNNALSRKTVVGSCLPIREKYRCFAKGASRMIFALLYVKMDTLKAIQVSSANYTAVKEAFATMKIWELNECLEKGKLWTSFVVVKWLWELIPKFELKCCNGWFCLLFDDDEMWKKWVKMIQTLSGSYPTKHPLFLFFHS